MKNYRKRLSFSNTVNRHCIVSGKGQWVRMSGCVMVTMHIKMSSWTSCIQVFLSSSILFIPNVQTWVVFRGFRCHRIYDQTVRQDGRYMWRDTPHHALYIKYLVHDSKPGVVSTTAGLINPSREITEERETKKEVSCYCFLNSQHFTCPLLEKLIYCVCDSASRNDLHSWNCLAMVE